MNHIKKILFLLLIFLSWNMAYSQSDLTPQSKTITGKETPIEGPNYSVQGQTDNHVPLHLHQKLEEARQSGDMSRFNAVLNEIKQLSGDSYKPALNVTNDMPQQVLEPPFVNDWYTIDRTVYTGDVDVGGWRQIDLKQGEDGNLYIAVNRRNVSGFTGYISVYRSTNYGVTWTGIGGVTTTGGYYGQVSMLVERRDNGSNMDSTRIMLFYTRSVNANFNDAAINFATFRRDGSAWYTGQIGTPTSGRKLLFPSAVSDGQYWGTATYMGVVVGDYVNGTSVGDNIKFYKTQDWCQTFTATTFNTGYNDYHPTAAYDDGGATTNDSVYIALERRFNTTNYLTRVMVIAWIPSTGSYTHFVPPTGTDKYEMPVIGIPQTGAYQNTTGRRMIITVIKNGIGVYHLSSNGGNGSWTTDAFLSGKPNEFTWVGTDSNVTAGNYCTAVFQSITSDSIGYRQGQIGSLGGTTYKRNSNQSSPSVNPVCETYKTTGATRYACFAYAGFGPTNVYFNAETILTGVTPSGNNVPETYSLSQNYPNPFNPATNIKFSIPKSGFVKLVVYDINGKEASVLVNGQMNAGSYIVDFNAANLASGVYFYKLVAEGFSDTKKMILVK
jgi:hypothetical protein